MQQELTTSKQIVEAEQKYKRMGKGRVIAQSRKVYRLLNTDVFYVESESSNDIYYFVKFKPDVIEWCTCPDNSMRQGQMRCKHIWSIEFAIGMETLKDTDRLPREARLRYDSSGSTVTIPTTIPPTPEPKSYTEDHYSF